MYLVISHRDRIVTYNPLSYNNIFLKYKKGGCTYASAAIWSSYQTIS